MVTKISPADKKPSARERLLAAAQELFYEEGINTVGIDKVIERAGVAKASLYDTFGSKEELVRSYLAGRHEARQERMARILARHTDPRQKLLAVFDVAAEIFAQPSFRGCAFIRASAEVGPDSSVRGVVDDSRKWLHDLLVGLAKDAGARNPAKLARQLVLLYDGATLSAQMDGNPNAAATARAMAEMLIDADRKSRARR